MKIKIIYPVVKLRVIYLGMHDDDTYSYDYDEQLPDNPKVLSFIIAPMSNKSQLHFWFQVADDFCPTGIELPGLGVLSHCVPIDTCPSLLDDSYAPINQILPCGFDTGKKIMKICCPPELVVERKVICPNKTKKKLFFREAFI